MLISQGSTLGVLLGVGSITPLHVMGSIIPLHVIYIFYILSISTVIYGVHTMVFI